PTVLSSKATPTTCRPSPMCGPSPATPAPATRTGSWLPRPRSNSVVGRIGGALLALAVASCTTQPPAPSTPPPPEPEQLSLARAGFADLPGWSVDSQEQALAALQRSCGRITTLADDAPVDPTLNQTTFGQVRDWRAPCEAARTLGTAGPE